MSARRYSIVIPVYNRPEELLELLKSLEVQESPPWFEVVVIEDGSTKDARQIAESFQSKFPVQYHFKENTGPGDSRNFGMSKAEGDYFIILDSDCLLPPRYLQEVEKELTAEYCPLFGGPDRARTDFNSWQKAVSYSMTSPLSTGGIRGRKNSVGRFQPRSFNMGISAELFRESGGFGDLHPGEDPDLSLRIFKEGHQSRLFPEAYVYHKRRIDTKGFLKQVYLFGLARPLLNKWHPSSAKPVFYLPSLYLLGSVTSIVLAFLGFYWPLYLLMGYGLAVFVHAGVGTRSLKIAFQSIYAVNAQLIGYGWGFLKSKFLLTFRKESPEQLLPELFRFKKTAGAK